MLRVLKTIAAFSRKAKKTVDPQTIEFMKQKVVQRAQKKRFKMPDQFKHQDIYFEEVVYGNKCAISGITQNNVKSAEFTQEVLSSTKPKLVILGGLSDTQALVDLDEPIGRFHNLQTLNSSKLYCKSTFLPTVQKKIEEDIDYYYDNQKKIIWKTDRLNRCLQINDYVNAAYQSLALDFKLIYGKPSTIFIFEDLMLTLSLSDLKQIFENTIKKINQTHVNSCQHIAPVILQHFKTHSMLNEPRLYSKEITYTTALLNRLTKIQSRNLLLINNCFVRKIAQNVHHTDFEPESVYRKWMEDVHSENYEKFSVIMRNKKIHQLIQKFAILCILKGFHLETILRQGRNIFKSSIFSELLGKYTHQEVLKIYQPYKWKYMQKLFQIQRQRIKNKIQYSPGQTQRMFLNDQFQTLQKRQKMFLYQFRPKNYLTEVENSQKIQKLQQKIKEIVETQCDDYEKTLIDQYKKGNKSKENIILFSKLIGKANVELKQKVRLPYYHFNAFRGFYKEYYRDSLLFDKELKQRRLEKKKLNKIQERFDRIGKQIKDPQMIRKYLSGEMGQKAKQINMYQDERGEVDIDGDIDDLQEIVQQLGNQDMKKDLEEYRKNNPKQSDQFDDGMPYDEDEHDSKDDDDDDFVVNKK